MKNKFMMLAIVLMAAVSISGCRALKEDLPNSLETPVKSSWKSTKESVPVIKETLMTFPSEEGGWTVDATNLWLEDNSLHEESSLSLVNAQYNSYFILLQDKKENLPKGIDLTNYAELAGEATLADLKEGEVTSMEDVKFGGITGKRFYIKGKIDDISITYIFLVFQNENDYFQEIIWSSSENIENNQGYYSDILLSFKFAR